jgi:TIR domain
MLGSPRFTGKRIALLTMAGRVFISYSKQRPQPTRDLASFLEEEGFTVWWDTDLTAGEVFREVIDRELDAADAVIVIWTLQSVTSKWVIAEAEHADRDCKLIPVRTSDVEPGRIPKPHSTC